MRALYTFVRTTTNFAVYEVPVTENTIKVIYLPKDLFHNFPVVPTELAIITSERNREIHRCNCEYCLRKI